MTSIAQALAQASTLDVEAGGLHWRVRRLASADLVEAGSSVLLGARRGPGPRDEQAVAAAEALLADPTKVRDGLRFFDAVAAAGVVAASADGGTTWQDLRLVLDFRAHAPASNTVHVSSLLPGVAATLAQAILDLSRDGGAAGERLAGFLRGKPDPARRPRK